jgi:hypothetical protein
MTKKKLSKRPKRRDENQTAFDAVQRIIKQTENKPHKSSSR